MSRVDSDTDRVGTEKRVESSMTSIENIPVFRRIAFATIDKLSI
jgi:hypothetical protein